MRELFLKVIPEGLGMFDAVEIGLVSEKCMRNYVICQGISKMVKENTEFSKAVTFMAKQCRVRGIELKERQIRNIYSENIKFT